MVPRSTSSLSGGSVPYSWNTSRSSGWLAGNRKVGEAEAEAGRDWTGWETCKGTWSSQVRWMLGSDAKGFEERVWRGEFFSPVVIPLCWVMLKPFSLPLSLGHCSCTWTSCCEGQEKVVCYPLMNDLIHILHYICHSWIHSTPRSGYISDLAHFPSLLFLSA